MSQQSPSKNIISSPVRDTKEKEKSGKKHHDLFRDFRIGEETDDEEKHFEGSVPKDTEVEESNQGPILIGTDDHQLKENPNNIEQEEGLRNDLLVTQETEKEVEIEEHSVTKPLKGTTAKNSEGYPFEWLMSEASKAYHQLKEGFN